MEQEKTIRIPVHQEERIARIRRVIQQLSQRLLRNPTIDEISKETNYSNELIEELMLYEQQSNQISSLNQAVKDDDDDEIEMFTGLIDDNYEKIENDILVEDIINLMRVKSFPRNEGIVIKMRFGLEDNIPHTLDEIGKEMGVSRERVRMIEKKAIERLRITIFNRKNIIEEYNNNNQNNQLIK